MKTHSFWSRYGWIIKYPFLFVRMMWLKFRFRNLPEEAYQEYQNAFYSSNSRLVSNDTDKFHKIREPIARFAYDFGHNKSVLEVGGGAGFQTGALVEQGFERITSSDLSPERVAHATRRNTDPRLDFKVADASDLPFDDDSYDTLVAVAILHSMPNRIKRQALAEFIRVTRNTIVIFEPLVLDRRGPLRWFFAKLTWLFDESQYIDDFVRDPYDADLEAEGFALVDRQRGFMGVTEIKVYQRV